MRGFQGGFGIYYYAVSERVEVAVLLAAQGMKITERSDVRPKLIHVLQRPDSAFSTYQVVDL